METKQWIETTCKRVLESWHNKKALAEKMRSDPQCHSRDRNIFYDTDNINEHQQEEITICDDCAGALKIDSSARGGHHILAVHIPANACPKCQDQGLQWNESATPDRYDQIHLQNRVDDSYQQR